MLNSWLLAKKHLAGGVNSPVRAFRAVGGDPIFMKRAKGAFLFDSNGKRYTDYCLSWGAILLGHADLQTVRAVQCQSEKGLSFGTVTEYETALAMEIKKAFPGMERIRFTSSGTEAVMSAIRLARGITKKSRIIKFEGCYHGHADSLLVKAGSGLATFGSPSSDGVPKEMARLTTVLPYNDLEALRPVFRQKKDIACVIVEPIAANMGLVPAKKEFLEAVRTLTKQNGVLLIFDEVITGFRLTYGGAQHLYGIEPDVTVLGKIIGGGMPIGAFGARANLMRALSPEGRVYQAGTLSGNPISMAAGLSVLKRLSGNFYKKLHEKTSHFTWKASQILKKRSGRACIQRSGSMFTIFFSSRAPRNFKEVFQTDTKRFGRFFHALLRRGVYFPPSAFETCFLSQAHGQKELAQTLESLYYINL